jgi:hypothetical protein
MNFVKAILVVSTPFITVIVLNFLLPKIEYLFSRIPDGRLIKINDLSEEDRHFLKENSPKYKKIENYGGGLLMLIGFIVLVNYYKFDLILPNLFLTEAYTGAKIFVVGIVSISYWTYFLARIFSLLIFGKKKGILMTDYEYVPRTNNTQSKIVFHPYKKLYGKKVFLVLILTLIILVL